MPINKEGIFAQTLFTPCTGAQLTATKFCLAIQTTARCTVIELATKAIVVPVMVDSDCFKAPIHQILAIRSQPMRVGPCIRDSFEMIEVAHIRVETKTTLA